MTTLEVRDLVKDFRTGGALRRQTVYAVADVSFELQSGRTLALVGESGSGKSTVARILAQLDRPTAGEVLLDSRPVPFGGRAVRAYRNQVQMVFQDPFASLNPAHTVGYHLTRPLLVHGIVPDRSAARPAVMDLLRRVNLTPAERIADAYPHELSGGQRQRVAIARALAPRPSVLLADEPVSMLDVSIRLEILNLLKTLQEEDDLAVLYITHDLATARHFSDEIMVMYRGMIVERGASDDVILRPSHPYTQLLAAAAPDPTAERPERAERVARTAGGRVESGCLFRDRCVHVMDVCTTDPPVVDVAAGHLSRCWLHEPTAATPEDAAAPV